MSAPEFLSEESTILRFLHLHEKLTFAVKILGVVNDILTEQGLLLISASDYRTIERKP